MKSIQYLSNEYIHYCKKIPKEEIILFLENYREMMENSRKFRKESNYKRIKNEELRIKNS